MYLKFKILISLNKWFQISKPHYEHKRTEFAKFVTSNFITLFKIYQNLSGILHFINSYQLLITSNNICNLKAIISMS